MVFRLEIGLFYFPAYLYVLTFYTFLIRTWSYLIKTHLLPVSRISLAPFHNSFIENWKHCSLANPILNQDRIIRWDGEAAEPGLPKISQVWGLPLVCYIKTVCIMLVFKYNWMLSNPNYVTEQIDKNYAEIEAQRSQFKIHICS